MIGPDEEIRLPVPGARVVADGQLAVVVGRSARSVTAAEALACVAGYCAGNDLTWHDHHDPRGQRYIGKSCDSFAPFGPVLVTADEVPDPQDLSVTTSVSGDILRSGRTKTLRFPVADLVAFASRLMTLEPGDVILTGSPGDGAETRRAPRLLRDGDLVEVAIERVGRLRNYVRGIDSSGA